MSTSYCPAPDDGPAADQSPSVPWGGVATLTRPGVEFTGECLGVGAGFGGLGDYDYPKSCPQNVGVRTHSHQATAQGTARINIDFVILGPAYNDTMWLNVTFSRPILNRQVLKRA